MRNASRHVTPGTSLFLFWDSKKVTDTFFADAEKDGMRVEDSRIARPELSSKIGTKSA